MKKLFILAFVAIICSTYFIQGNANKTNASSSTDTSLIRVYKFKNRILNLDLLKIQDASTLKNYVEIKRENLHPDYFNQNLNDKKVVYKNFIFELKENREISISDNKGKLIKTIPDPDKNISSDNTSGNAVIFSVSSGIISVIRLSEENGYHINKYDENGTVLNTWIIAHTIYKKYDNTVESIPYMYYFAHTNKEVVFSSMHYGDPHETIILNIEDGTQKKITNSTGAIIIDPKNNSLAGTINFNDDKKMMEVTMGNKTWKTENEGTANSAKTVLKDSVLFVARYHSIATGSHVNTYNAYTGKLLWKGDVKQLNVGHSEYYNSVFLTLYKDKLILEGNEAGGDYLQVLDAKTGKNLFELMPDTKY
jgi:hypothetical protein